MRVKAQNQILEVDYAYAFTEKDIEMDNHTTTLMSSPTNSDEQDIEYFKSKEVFYHLYDWKGVRI